MRADTIGKDRQEFHRPDGPFGAPSILPNRGDPIMADRPLRILFSSYHSYLDPSSGSTISLRDLFQLLTGRGWNCQVFCGPQLDYEEPRTIPELLETVKIPFDTRRGGAHGLDFRLYNAIIDDIPVALYETPDAPPTRNLTEQQGKVHAALFEEVLNQFRPDILLTYGGQIMAYPCMVLARQRGTKVVFWLRNTAYSARDFFYPCNGAIVPSEFSTEYYRKTIGIRCTSLPSPLDWERVHCEHIERKYLTFINPSPVKGVYFLAGILKELSVRKPDIPVLVVEGRGGVKWLEKTGFEAQSLPNIRGMRNTRDPREFFSMTRVLLAPSLWQETFGRVTAESLINGIPVLASTRGGLREVVNKGGFLFDIPDSFQPETREMPPRKVVTPWVDTILRLWEDESYYVTACLNARVEAEKWQPEKLADRYEDYFREIVGTR